ncbi:hypothetical protein ACFWDA_06950 [Rhodococcus zopfii]|uniref:hypothetical protein n=1 Tax=Rhodococcus zopfii TaxID=43772 RepID=UPI0009336AD1|nr:hypothetical protein [Rhodococcus zopfii]
MVLPLIPVALIAAGALTGGRGVALGGRGVWDLKKADGRIESARSRYEKRYEETESCVAATNERIAELGAQQKHAIETVVVRFVEFLRTIEQQVRGSQRVLADGVESDQARVAGGENLSIDPVAWLGGVIGSAVSDGCGRRSTTRITSWRSEPWMLGSW